MPPNSTNSRILTLVFTDLADSTALKSSRGDDAVDALLTRHREHVTRRAAECSGRIIDWAGDGCFLTFETSSAGVLFALQLQKAHSDEADLPGVRVGIHLGEVTERPGPDDTVQVKGLAVDVAARIEGLAKPGQVLMSSSVYNSARQRMGVEAMGMPLLWQLHGTYELKGFDTPLDIAEAGFHGVAPLGAPKIGEKARLIRKARKQKTGQFKDPRRHRLPVWGMAVMAALLAGVGYLLWERASRSGSAAPGQSITSIAVLPLDNLKGDPAEDYFVDGMTEAITGELSKISSLKVISRTSTVRYKDTTLTMPQIAEELGVQGIIEGSVLRDGDDVTIRVRLFDGPTENQLWNDDYTKPVTSVLKLHAEVALAIAGEIKAAIEPEERQRISEKQEIDPRASDAFLRALHAYGQQTRESLGQSVAYLDEATELQPNFATAWAYIPRVVGDISGWGWGPGQETNPKSKAAALRAIEIDPDLAIARYGLGTALWHADWNWTGAEREFRRALELASQDGELRYNYAWLLMLAGRGDEAIERFSEGIERSPLSLTMLYSKSWALANMGRYDEAIATVNSLLQIEPDFPPALIAKGRALILTGQYDAAIEVLSRAVGRLDSDYATSKLAIAHIGNGELDRARQILSDIVENEAGRYQQDMHIASVYAGLNEYDHALKHLQKAIDERQWSVLELRSDPFFDSMRNDERYWEMVDKIGYPPLPVSDPVYPQQQAYLTRQAAKELLAEQGLDGAPRIESIAVLPLHDLSAGADDYFAESMTEAITSELAKIKALEVRGRTSAMQYADKGMEISEIAKALNVDALIEGSVTRDGDEVRIDVRLMHGATDTPLSSFTRTETITSILKLQSDVALAIAEAVNTEITGEERERIATTREVDSRAYDEYVLGKHFAADVTEDGQLRAIRHFEEATRRDPDFAEAWVELGGAQSNIPGFGLGSAHEYYPAARESYQRALEVDPEHPEAHSGLAWVTMGYDFDWARAEEQFLRALDLSPNSAQVLTEYGWLLLVVGRETEAARLAGRAVEIDPEDPWIVRPSATILEQAGQPARARDAMEALLAEDPDFVPAIESLLTAHLALGNRAEAIAAAERLAEVSERNSSSLIWLINVLATVGETVQAETVLEELLVRDDYVQDGALGRAYVSLGRIDDAFAAFERGFERRDWILAWLRTAPYRPYWRDHPGFQKLLNDERYWALIKRMNFPPLPPEHLGYAEEQAWLINKRAEELIAERGLAPIQSN